MEGCTALSVIMIAGPQGGCFQGKSRSDLQNPMSEVYGVIRNRDLPSSPRMKTNGNSNSLWCFGSLLDLPKQSEKGLLISGIGVSVTQSMALVGSTVSPDGKFLFKLYMYTCRLVYIVHNFK